MKKITFIISFSFLGLFLFSCSDNGTGLEYAPNMYVSEPLEGLSQTANSKFPYNKNNMTMREPVTGSIARGKMPYRISADSIDQAATVQNPIALSDDVLKEGAELYGRFCKHCHGETGSGDGLVGQKYKGVPKYNSAAIKDKTMGHLFHVMTYGKGRMNSHASQLSAEERWKVAHFVQTLQKQ